MDIKKGQSVTVSRAFKIRGIAVTFVQPPVWVLTNSVGKVLLQGTAVPNGSRWEATFTISSNYVVPNGEEELSVEFSGISDTGRSYSATRDVTLLDVEDTFQPIGILYSLVTTADLIDTFYADSSNVTSAKYSIYTPYDTLVTTLPTFTGLTPTQRTSKGYEFSLNLGRPDPTDMLRYNDPFIGILEYFIGSSTVPITEFHPIYAVNAKIAARCNALKQFLDKSQLIEIDPSLQWFLPEFTHYLQEGMKHINGTINSVTAQLTYWTIADCPMQLQQHLFAAAALYALNSRYLAEGFNHFEFSGLNTSLNFDRRDAITYKIEELKSFLDSTLATTKAAVLNAGTPVGSTPTDATITASTHIGILGLQGSSVSNKLQRRATTVRFI